MEDLSAATVEDVAAFFKTYYAPNNAVVAIVGDVKTSEVLEKARKYFESIPSQPAPPPVDMTEPAPSGEERMTLEDPLARLTRVDISYLVPPSSHNDDAALTVLATVLSGGRSGRFFENIVRQKQLATGVSASKGEARGPGLFRVIGTVAPGKSAADVESAIYEEIERVKTGGVQAWEIEKARTNARRGMVASLQSSLQRAILLSEYALFYNDPGRINKRAARIDAVTAADVQRVANTYLTQVNRNVVTTVPKPAASRPGGQP